jgi:hypothetical protein
MTEEEQILRWHANFLPSWKSRGTNDNVADVSMASDHQITQQ